MELALQCEIKIDKLVLDFAHKVEVKSSRSELADTCVIQIPATGILETDEQTQELSFEEQFKVGMPVSVKLGFSGYGLNEEFTGYIAQVKPKVPFELVCEDEMFQLKRSEFISASFNGSLKSLLSTYFGQVQVSGELPDVQLTNFVIKRATKADLLQKIKDEYGFVAYFRGKQLYVGLPYLGGVADAETVRYSFQRNIIEDNLTYKRKDDVRIRVKAISFLPQNKKLEVEAGDSDGETRTFITQGETSKERLEQIALSKVESFKYEGYSGTFRTLGEPFVRHGDLAALEDSRYKERAGQTYLVESVDTVWGVDGYERTITPSIKVGGV